MILEEESVSCYAPLSPNNKTKELREKKTHGHILVNPLPASSLSTDGHPDIAASSICVTETTRFGRVK